MKNKKITPHSSAIARNLAQLKFVMNNWTGKEYDQVFFTAKCKEMVLRWLTECQVAVPSKQEYNRLVANI